MSDAETIRRQHAEIELLREQVRQLRELLVPVFELPSCLRLSQHEHRIVVHLFKHYGHVSRESLNVVLYAATETEHCCNIISVHISKVRRKLKPFGLVLKTRYGGGYALTSDSRRKLAQMIEDERR